MGVSSRRLSRQRLRRQCLRTVLVVVSLSLLTEGTTSGNGKNAVVSLFSFGVSTRHDGRSLQQPRRPPNLELSSLLRRFNGNNGEPASSTDATAAQQPPPPPLPPIELPLRFLRAGKGDPDEGLRRYEATLAWRKEEKIDTILREDNPDFPFIKQHYPHFFHMTGKNNEPVYYEQPARTNLEALGDGGVTVDKLLRHYTMITEFQWQYLCRDDTANSIFIIDLVGIRIKDFAGAAVDFTKKASKLSAQHYPERAGFVFVINVPRWFKLIWKVIRPLVDETTLEKIYILRGEEEIRKNLMERIPLHHIPPEYGGTSMPLGQSPEERLLCDLMEHNRALAARGRGAVCDGCTGANPEQWHCQFCKWTPARSY